MRKSHVLPVSIAAMLAAGVCLAPAMAQDAAKPADPAKTTAPAEAPAAAQALGWSVQCATPTAPADAALKCQAEQSILVMPSRQLLLSVVMQMSDAKAPHMIVHLPLGLLIPAGVTAQVDDGKALALALQTCDGQACYADADVAPDMVAALGKGKNLTVAFQNVKKAPITVPVPLAGFAPAFGKVQ